MTWDDFLTSISWFVDKYSYHEQTPFHDIYPLQKQTIILPQESVKDEIEELIEEQVPNSIKEQGQLESTNWINDITNCLGDLIDRSKSDEDRIELEMSISNLFAEDAQIKFLAQDSDLVIDKESVDVFLGRLSTSRLLLNVVVVGGEIDSTNKIKLLKVREIYKR